MAARALTKRQLASLTGERYIAAWWASRKDMDKVSETMAYTRTLADALEIANKRDINGEGRASKEVQYPVTGIWRHAASYNHDGEQFCECE